MRRRQLAFLMGLLIGLSGCGLSPSSGDPGGSPEGEGPILFGAMWAESPDYVVAARSDGVVVVFGVLLFLFILFFTVTDPDDIARRSLGEKAGAEVVEQWKANHGYDKPLWPTQDLRENLLFDHFRRMQDAGVTHLWMIPWMLYGGDPASLQVKQDGLKRFADEVIAVLA